jgi:hypothetical protein
MILTRFCELFGDNGNSKSFVEEWIKRRDAQRVWDFSPENRREMADLLLSESFMSRCRKISAKTRETNPPPAT